MIDIVPSNHLLPVVLIVWNTRNRIQWCESDSTK